MISHRGRGARVATTHAKSKDCSKLKTIRAGREEYLSDSSADRS